MKNVELLVKQDLFENIGVTIDQLHYSLDEKNFKLYGSVSSTNDKLKGYVLYLKVNFCNEDGKILFLNKNYKEINFDKVKYDGFSLTFLNPSGCFDIEKLHHMEIYPYVERISEED